MANLEERGRRTAGYWAVFNTWWRNFYEDHGERPKSDDLKRWHREESQRAFPDDPPTYVMLRNHAKGLRDIKSVKSYFRDYRARKRRASRRRGAEPPSDTDDDDGDESGGGGGGSGTSDGSRSGSGSAGAAADADTSDEDWAEGRDDADGPPRRKRRRREPPRRQAARPPPTAATTPPRRQAQAQEDEALGAAGWEALGAAGAQQQQEQLLLLHPAAQQEQQRRGAHPGQRDLAALALPRPALEQLALPRLPALPLPLLLLQPRGSAMMVDQEPADPADLAATLTITPRTAAGLPQQGKSAAGEQTPAADAGSGCGGRAGAPPPPAPEVAQHGLAQQPPQQPPAPPQQPEFPVRRLSSVQDPFSSPCAVGAHSVAAAAAAAGHAPDGAASATPTGSGRSAGLSSPGGCGGTPEARCCSCPAPAASAGSLPPPSPSTSPSAPASARSAVGASMPPEPELAGASAGGAAGSAGAGDRSGAAAAAVPRPAAAGGVPGGAASRVHAPSPVAAAASVWPRRPHHALALGAHCRDPHVSGCAGTPGAVRCDPGVPPGLSPPELPARSGWCSLFAARKLTPVPEDGPTCGAGEAGGAQPADADADTDAVAMLLPPPFPPPGQQDPHEQQREQQQQEQQLRHTGMDACWTPVSSRAPSCHHVTAAAGAEPGTASPARPARVSPPESGAACRTGPGGGHGHGPEQHVLSGATISMELDRAASLPATGGPVPAATDAHMALAAGASMQGPEGPLFGSAVDAAAAGPFPQPWTPFALPAAGAMAAAVAAADVRPPVTTALAGWWHAASPAAARRFASLPAGVGLGGPERQANGRRPLLDPAASQPPGPPLAPLAVRRAATCAPPLGAADGGGGGGLLSAGASGTIAGGALWRQRSQTPITAMSLGGRSDSGPLPVSMSVSVPTPTPGSLPAGGLEQLQQTGTAVTATAGGVASPPDRHTDMGLHVLLPNPTYGERWAADFGPDHGALPPAPQTGPPPVTTGFTPSKGLARSAAAAAVPAMPGEATPGLSAAPALPTSQASARTVLTGAHMAPQEAPQGSGGGGAAAAAISGSEPAADLGPAANPPQLLQGASGPDGAGPAGWPPLLPAVAPAAGPHDLPVPLFGGAAYGYRRPPLPSPFGRIRRVPIHVGAPWPPRGAYAYPPSYPYPQPYPYPCGYPPPEPFGHAQLLAPERLDAAAALVPPPPRFLPYMALRRYPHPPPAPLAGPFGALPGHGSQPIGSSPPPSADSTLPPSGITPTAGPPPPPLQLQQPMGGSRGAALALLSLEPWSQPGYEDLRPPPSPPLAAIPFAAAGGLHMACHAAGIAHDSCGSPLLAPAPGSSAPGYIGAAPAAVTAEPGGSFRTAALGGPVAAAAIAGGSGGGCEAAPAGCGGGDGDGDGAGDGYGGCIIERLWAMCDAEGVAEGEGNGEIQAEGDELPSWLA